MFGQNEFIIKGTITKALMLPVDSSVCVTIKLGQTELYKTYCNNEGKYSFTIPNALNGKEINIAAYQEYEKVKSIYRVREKNCSFICWDFLLFNSAGQKKITLKADSTKEYIANFVMGQSTPEMDFPTIYFKKNELTMVQSDDYLSADSALCEITGMLNCRKNMVIELSGYCSSEEKHKNRLSKKRAQLVKSKLVKLGINPARIVAKGYPKAKDFGKWEQEYRPAYINQTDYEGQTVSISALSNDFDVPKELKRKVDDDE
jgi:outer membrane protein OmpA-like peptidoglycan-associated protein